MRITLLCCCAMISLLAPASAYGYAAVVSIDDLIAQSDVIVIARVTSLRLAKPPKQELVATADVSATWKGDAVQSTVEYVASRGWFMCDTSDAVVGETVVLFLERDESDHRLHIAHFGRGRMPIVGTADHRQAKTYEVIFPASRLPPKPELPVLNKTIALNLLERIVRREVNRPRR